MNKSLFMMVLYLFAFVVKGMPVPAEYLFKSPAYSQLTFSPDGSLISLYNDREHTNFFSVVDVESRQLTALAELGNSDSLRKHIWLSDTFVLLQVASSRGISNVILEVKKESGNLKATPHPLKTSGYLVHRYPSDPNKVLFAKKTGNYNGGFRLYKIRIKDLIEGIFEEKDRVKYIASAKNFFSYDEVNDLLITGEFDPDEETLEFEYKKFDAFSWLPLLLIKDSEYVFQPIGLTSENTMLVLTNKDSDTTVLRTFDILNQSFGDTVFEHPRYDLSGATLNSKTGQVESVSYLEHGRLTYHFFNEKQKQESELVSKAFPERQFVIVSQHDSTSRKILLTFSSGHPGTFHLYDAGENVAETLFEQYPSLSKYTFSVSDTIRHEYEDGVAIEAFLTQPTKGSLNHDTLLVMPHGGPIGVRDTDFFNRKVQYFASRGFSVLRVNFRGSAGFGTKFKKAGVGEFGKLIERDISAIVSKLQTDNTFSHYCTIGSSYGGYSAFMLAIANPELYECIVASFGIYDIPLLFNDSNLKIQDDYIERVENTVGKFNESLFDLSPVYLSDNVMAPSLIIAGIDDDIASYEHSSRMAYTLRKLGKTVDTLDYEKTGHGHYYLWGLWHENAYVYDFITKTLGLTHLKREDIHDDDIDLIANEFARVGASFESPDRVQDNPAKASYFLNLAAGLGSSDAIVSMAEKQLDTAAKELDGINIVEKLTKAAELDNPEALVKLGDIYFAGEIVERDVAKSHQMYEQAKALGYHAGIYSKLAKAVCLGYAEPPEGESCHSLITIDDEEKSRFRDNSLYSSSYQDRENAIYEMVTSGLLTNANTATLHDAIKDEFNVEMFPFHIEVEEYGLRYDEQFNNYKFDENKAIVAKNDTSFGMHFDVSADAIYGDNRKKVALIGHWSVIDEKGNENIRYKVFLHGTQKRWSMWITLKDKNGEVEPAIWSLKLYDMFGTQVHSQEFEVVAP